jgi:hypothetical protein
MIQIICTIIAAVVSPALMLALSYFVKDRQERRRQEEETGKLRQALENSRQETQEFYMLALKCAITNRELSRQARLEAYDKYKKAGGNSWVDGYAAKYLKIVED